MEQSRAKQSRAQTRNPKIKVFFWGGSVRTPWDRINWGNIVGIGRGWGMEGGRLRGGFGKVGWMEREGGLRGDLGWEKNPPKVVD